MLSEAFLRIMNDYSKASTEGFNNHALANYIRHEFPEILKEKFPNDTDLLWVASPGQGRWADAPWLAIFDPLVTDTAQDGYYPVYLFTKSLNSVYLSLNQGMTNLRKEFSSTDAKEKLANRAEILRIRVPEFHNNFMNDKLNLEHTGNQTRLAFYEPGHAFGLRYEKVSFPQDEKLIRDLALMLNFYRLATERGGTDDFDSVHAIAEEQHSYDVNVTLEEKRRLQYHYRIERNAKLAREVKKVLGYKCQVCGFDYSAAYGDLGKEYIEAHHLIPLSKLPKGQSVQLSPSKDFAVVCANCHRMIHRKGAPETFDEFKALYARLNS